MQLKRFTIYEIITCIISSFAFIVSVWSVYLQFHKVDNLIFRSNPILYDGINQKFEFVTVNLGNASGMVNIQSLVILKPESDTKGEIIIPIDKTMIVKPGEMESTSIRLIDDIFNKIIPDNKKRKLYLNFSHLDSHGKSKSGKLSIGFITMSGSKRTIYSDSGSLDLSKLPYDKGGHFVIFDNKFLKYGNSQMGFDKLEYSQDRSVK